MHAGARAGILTVALLGLLLPAGAAQVPEAGALETAVQVEVTPTAELAEPLGRPLEIPVLVRYRYLNVAPAPESTTIALRVEGPASFVTSFAPSEIVMLIASPPCGCERTAEANATLLVTASPESSAYETLKLLVVAAAGANGPYGASEGTVDVPVTAGAFVRLAAETADATLRVPRGSTASTTLTVTNQGNAAAFVRPSAVPPPGYRVELPIQVGVGAVPQGSDPVVRVQLLVRAASDAAPGVLDVTLHGRAAETGAGAEEPARLRIQLEPTGVWMPVVEVDAAFPLVVLLVVGAAVGTLRRRRRAAP